MIKIGMPRRPPTTPKVCEQPTEPRAHCFLTDHEFEEQNLLDFKLTLFAFWVQALFGICLKALFFLRVFIWPLAQFLWNWAVPTATLSIGTLFIGTVLTFSLIPFGTELFPLEVCHIRTLSELSWSLAWFLMELGSSYWNCTFGNFSCWFRWKKSQRNGIPVIRMLWGCPWPILCLKTWISP